MAILVHDATGRRVALVSRTLVGRSRSAHVRQSSARTSGEHALLTWTPTGWVLRDLGSRNGTWVDGERVAAGARVPLQSGHRLGFGDAADAWTLASDGEPGALATDGRVWIEGEGELLGIPDLDEPEILVERSSRGWTLAGEPVQEGFTVEYGGRYWTLHLSEDLPPTVDAGLLTLADVGLDFAVSSDEEYVELTVRLGKEVHALKPRAHHELLLMLARRRLHDPAGADVSEAERGWIYAEDLEKAQRASSNQIYVAIHRARKELAQLGVADAADLVERRSTSRQVRIGVSDLTVRALG